MTIDESAKFPTSVYNPATTCKLRQVLTVFAAGAHSHQMFVSPPATASTNKCYHTSLSQRINHTTHQHHTRLNQLILSLLPLGLPPQASTPKKYLQGIAHILPIYEAFEHAFRGLFAAGGREVGHCEVVDGQGEKEAGRRKEVHIEKSHKTVKEDGAEDEEQSLHDRRHRDAVREAMRSLHMPALERTERLRQDISPLHWPSPGRPPDMSKPESLPSPSHCSPNFNQINKDPTPYLTAFTNHIASSVLKKPHLLLAYTWLFYMALFSGGRHIRFALRNAGVHFWNSLSNEERKVDEYLAFWTFDGPSDGVYLKGNFKRRFTEAEAVLTEAEKEEVVAESVYIMQTLIVVVQEIAAVVGGSSALLAEEERRADEASQDIPVSQLLLKHILPMGMVELIIGAWRGVDAMREPLCN